MLAELQLLICSFNKYYTANKAAHIMILYKFLVITNHLNTDFLLHLSITDFSLIKCIKKNIF